MKEYGGSLVVGVLLLSLAASGSLTAVEARSPEDLVFLPGYEAEALSLLGPQNADDALANDWILESAAMGPECRIRFVFCAEEGRETISLQLRPRLAPEARGSQSITFHWSPPLKWLSRRGMNLVNEVERRIHGNDTGDFFGAVCREVEIVAVDTAQEQPDPREPSRELMMQGNDSPLRTFRRFVTPAVFFAATLGVMILTWRRTRVVATDLPERLLPRRRLLLAILLVMMLAVRFGLMAVQPPGSYEAENFFPGAAVGVTWLEHILEVVSRGGPAAFLAPLADLLLWPWLLLGNKLGWGGELLWLRLPNLALSAWLVLRLVRLGRLVGFPAAGWGAAALFSFLPTMVAASVCQGHYFLEMVLATWFLERLATVVLCGQPVFTTLAVAAAAALWAGHICLLVVGPGFAIFLVWGVRKKRLEPAFLTTLLLVLLVAPIADDAAIAVLRYLGLQVDSTASEETLSAVERELDHPPLLRERRDIGSFFLFPVRTADRLAGPVFAVLVVGGFAALWRTRPRSAVFPTFLLAVFAAADTQMYLRWPNLAVMQPLMLFVPLWGVCTVRSSAHRYVPHVWVALALLSGVWAWAREIETYDAREHLPRVPQLIAYHERGNALDEPSLLSVPVAVLDDTVDLWYLLCSEKDTAHAVVECMKHIEAFVEINGARRDRLGVREVMIRVPYGSAGRPVGTCGGFPEMASSVPWTGEYLVLSRDRWDLMGRDDSLCRGAFDDACCALEVDLPGFVLVTCRSSVTDPRSH